MPKKTPTLEGTVELDCEPHQEKRFRYTYLAGLEVDVIAKMAKKTGEVSAYVERYAGSDSLTEYIPEDLADTAVIMAMDEIKKPAPKRNNASESSTTGKKPNRKTGGSTIKPVTGGHTVTQEMLDANTLIERINASCRAAEISRNTLSREASVSPGTFWLWKEGQKPSDVTLRRISSFLGVRVKWLKTGETPVLDKRLHGIFEKEHMTEAPASRFPMITAKDAEEFFSKDESAEVITKPSIAEDMMAAGVEKHVAKDIFISPEGAEKSQDALSTVNSCISRLASLSPDKAKDYYRVLQEIRASLEGAVIFGESYAANLIPQKEMLPLLNDIIGDIRTLGLADEETRIAYKIFSERRSAIELELLNGSPLA